MNLVFKAFPRISIPPMIPAIHGIMTLSGLLSKIQGPMCSSESPSKNLILSWEILIVEIQPVLLKKLSLTLEKNRYKLHFWQIQPRKVRIQEISSEYVYPVTLHTDRMVQWDLDRRSPVGKFGDR